MRRDLSALDRDIGQPWSRIIDDAFQHGITNDMIFGGLEPGQTALQDLQTVQATKNCKIGTRRVRWDGRVFRYAFGTNIMTNIQQGIKFYDKIKITQTLPKRTQLVGESVVQIDSGKGAAGVAKDELVGGYLMVHTGTTANHQFRGIVANALADANGYVEITVDFPFTIALATAGHGVEIFQNPYSNVHQDEDDYSSVAGVLCTVVPAANRYLWLQTWGPCWMNPYGTLGSASVQLERGLVFDKAGNIIVSSDENRSTVGDDADYQRAGYIICRTTVGSGDFIMMLQLCP